MSNWNYEEQLRLVMNNSIKNFCKNFEEDCNNANICPCFLFRKCDYFCSSCNQSCNQNKLPKIDGLYTRYDLQSTKKGE